MSDQKTTYTLLLEGNYAGKMQEIIGKSDQAVSVFAKLQAAQNNVKNIFGDMGTSIGSLRQKLDLLKNEREWIPQKNIADIKRYNVEIGKLEKQISQLEKNGGNRFAGIKSAFDSLPFAGFVNPITAIGAGLAYSTQQSMLLKEGMAKINTTAQLSAGELGKLENKLISIGKNNNANLGQVPVGFEKILSQVGDVDTSLSILDASLKGSKGGFTDLGVVSGALAQTLSIVGKENTNAKEVLDTLFAAKRIGAGEFVDFANYMPGLVADTKNMGVNMKDTAGLFAYMTGKGQSAERSTTLLRNAVSALSKTDIQKGLKKEGVNLFDTKGQMRPIEDFLGDLQNKLASFGNNDQARSGFLEKIGLRDVEAKNAISILTSDLPKLKEALNATRNAFGETSRAVNASASPMQRMQETWARFQGIALNLGGVLVNVVDPVFGVINTSLTGLTTVVEGVGSGIGWWIDNLNESSPVIVALTAGVGVLTAAMTANFLIQKTSTYFAAQGGIMQTLLTLKTNILTGSIWKMNSALLANPWGWIAVGIGLASVAIYKFATHTDKLSESMSEAKKRAGEYYAQEKEGLDAIFERLKKTNPKSKERVALVEELKKSYPGLNTELEKELTTTNNTAKAYNALTSALMKKAMAEGMAQTITEQSSKTAKLYSAATYESVDNRKKLNNYLESHGSKIYDRAVAKYGKDEAPSHILALGSSLSNKAANKYVESKIALEKMVKTQVAFLKTNSGLFGSENANVDPFKDGGKSKDGGNNKNLNFDLTETSNNITSGGSRPTSITINLQKLQDKIEIHSTNIKEGVQEMETMVTEALLRVLNSANATMA